MKQWSIHVIMRFILVRRNIAEASNLINNNLIFETVSNSNEFLNVEPTKPHNFGHNCHENEIMLFIFVIFFELGNQ